MTLEYVIVDFRDGFIIFGSFYVAITRVRAGNNLFLRDFHPGFVKASKEVNDKIKEMRKEKPYQFFKTFLDMPCFKQDQNDLKIGYININCLTDNLHSEYINADKNLLCLEILCLSDTRLKKDISEENLKKCLSNWKILYRQDSSDKKKHMGLLVITPLHVYNKKWNQMNISFSHAEEVKLKSGETLIQVLHITHYEEVVSFIYCSVKPDRAQTAKIGELIQGSNYLLGDINLNPELKDDKSKLEIICGKNKMLYLRALTTVYRSQLDHVIVDKNSKHKIVTDCYLNLISDHKCIVMRKSSFATDEALVKTSEPQKEGAGKDEPKQITIEDTAESYGNVHSETSSGPNLSSLNGNEWLNDEVINAFMTLLMMKYPDCFIFSTFFSQQFFSRRRDYERFSLFDKSPSLFECRLVMIPLLQYAHWFLLVLDFEERKISIMDPYLGEDSSIENIKSQHYEEMYKIENEFFRKHYEIKTRRKWPICEKLVVLPPCIPEQKDQCNCGPFLIQIAR